MRGLETAFVTGATGLLGGNLVRELAARGVRVRALARSPAKAALQFGGLAGVEIVEGDMLAVPGFAAALAGVDVLFHTAAHFRDSYTGGDHWDKLRATNVDGARNLLSAAYDAGVRRAVMTSSIAVLDGPRGAVINETMVRRVDRADDYYRSKILADEVAFEAMKAHSDLDITLVLPGWMHGPGDAGPTSAGQVTLDFINRKLPGIVPATFSVVDARDVARALVASAERGRRGERYLAAGRHMTMADLLKVYEQVTGVAAPKGKVPPLLLLAIATVSEAMARLTGKPTLLSLATVRLMLREAERSRFDHAKSERELGVTFRPVAETLRDEIAWFRARGRIA
ncbi:MAG: SDR family oxidoreductase [Pseudomonadota bacterium]|uniref:SDR family oxidoreductase n=1 Tax=Phenylobacterium sp. TaxID=1871053 RepID=UPI0025F4EA01|nr:SDR family oxidoreductase [Phenylobacterium sp.]MBT9471681.1 SDR family oxidoreductase [Phenylobacterium sp.]